MIDEPESNHGITVVSATEDFSYWRWDNPLKKPEILAAELVIKELIKQTYIDLNINEGVVVARFETFEGNLTLARPLSAMLDEWIDHRRAYGDNKIHHDEDRKESVILLRLLEASAERLRQTLA